MISLDVVVIPVQLSFEPEDIPLTIVLFWVALVFWTLDMLLSFRTGYYTRGTEELHPRKIAKRYASTWMPLDILIVSSDWLVAASDLSRGGVSLARAGKTIRMLRILRSLRMLRLAKLKKVFNTLQDNITSQYAHIMIYMLKLILLILIINHLIACLFYALSVGVQDLYLRTWVEDAKESLDWTQFYLYLTALHW